MFSNSSNAATCSSCSIPSRRQRTSYGRRKWRAGIHMSKIVADVKRSLTRQADAAGFVDPITRLPPLGEVALTACLAYYYQRNAIPWHNIQLLPVANLETRSGMASEIMPENAAVLCEYPLLHRDEPELNVWGSMRADLIALSATADRVVLVENKIGCRFTYGDSPDEGQVAREMEYLLALSAPHRALVMVGSQLLFAKGWYVETIRAAHDFDARRKELGVYLMHWEQIIASFANQ